MTARGDPTGPKLVGIEPATYLAEAPRRAIANPGTVTLPRDLVSA